MVFHATDVQCAILAALIYTYVPQEQVHLDCFSDDCRSACAVPGLRLSLNPASLRLTGGVRKNTSACLQHQRGLLLSTGLEATLAGHLAGCVPGLL